MHVRRDLIRRFDKNRVLDMIEDDELAFDLL